MNSRPNCRVELNSAKFWPADFITKANGGEEILRGLDRGARRRGLRMSKSREEREKGNEYNKIHKTAIVTRKHKCKSRERKKK